MKIVINIPTMPIKDLKAKNKVMFNDAIEKVNNDTDVDDDDDDDDDDDYDHYDEPIDDSEEE